MDADSETGVINSGGHLNVSGDDAILIDGVSNAEVNNAGTITVSGVGFDAVLDENATQSGSIIANSGTITVTGQSSGGIDTQSIGAVVTNSGTITTDGGGSANPIAVYGAGSVVVNSGTVIVTGDDASAVGVYGESMSFVNSGTITSAAETGAIATNGSSANSTIVNSGVITITGASADGIAVRGDNMIVTNSGSIAVSGVGAAGLDLGVSSGNTQSFTNTGSIAASGNATQAIIGDEGVEVVYLGKGSRIIGTVDLGTGDDSVMIVGNGVSSRVLTANVENLSVGVGVAGVVVGSAVHGVDPTGSAALTLGASNLARTVNNIVNFKVGQGGKKGKIWVKAFGSGFERGADAQNLSYDHDYRGAMMGFDYDENSGVMIGASKGRIKTKTQSFESDVDSAFLGYYRGLKLADLVFVNANIIAGYEQYSNERALVDNINGAQTAKSDINNLFVSPSLEIEYRIKVLEALELRPNASVSYTNSFFSGASETGATESNIRYESRRAQVFGARVGLSTILTLFDHYKFNVGAGLDSREIKEGMVDAEISATQFSYATNNQKSVAGSYVNFGLDVVDFVGLTLGINAEVRSGDGEEEQESFSFSGSFHF